MMSIFIYTNWEPFILFCDNWNYLLILPLKASVNICFSIYFFINYIHLLRILLLFFFIPHNDSFDTYVKTEAANGITLFKETICKMYLPLVIRHPDLLGTGEYK